MEKAMTKKIALPLLTAMMMVCGGSAAIGQSYGNTDPAFADTTDPNSVPTGIWRRPGWQAQRYQPAYTRDQTFYRSPRSQRRSSRTAAEADPAFRAQRESAAFFGDAMNPYGATSSPPARR